MAIMSFAHLMPGAKKEKKNDLVPSNNDAVISSEKNNVNNATNCDSEAIEEKGRSTYAIPAVMNTAIIKRVNYCRGCPRFMSDMYAQVNNLPVSRGGYGWCLRDGGNGEEYKPIPAGAKVERCYYMLQEKKKLD